jgi:hypothetical protein
VWTIRNCNPPLRPTSIEKLSNGFGSLSKSGSRIPTQGVTRIFKMARHKISPKYQKTLTSTLLFHNFWMILFAKWGFFLNNFWPQQAGMGKKLSSIKERNQLSFHLPKPIKQKRNLSIILPEWHMPDGLYIKKITTYFALIIFLDF